ncbi:hypothetical protein DPMN_091863 [Dreissena polymorpha]|uniref:Uncharacterized protein n=1 Tax=Dreissena polymorpha TaxID=45954 RepID=A0A9D4L0X9_DREPO|nr:hypothetical protein DPMN_091863 [Dreissena polymorpha]
MKRDLAPFQKDEQIYCINIHKMVIKNFAPFQLTVQVIKTYKDKHHHPWQSVRHHVAQPLADHRAPVFHLKRRADLLSVQGLLCHSPNLPMATNDKIWLKKFPFGYNFSSYPVMVLVHGTSPH